MELREAIADLAECYRLSGADPDGNEDWRLAPSAVAEVRRLRHDYDEACTEACELRAALSALVERTDMGVSRDDDVMRAAKRALGREA
jgi:signal transduction histidine kinase